MSKTFWTPDTRRPKPVGPKHDNTGPDGLWGCPCKDCTSIQWKWENGEHGVRRTLAQFRAEEWPQFYA